MVCAKGSGIPLLEIVPEEDPKEMLLVVEELQRTADLMGWDQLLLGARLTVRNKGGVNHFIMMKSERLSGYMVEALRIGEAVSEVGGV